jgi:hypothetical protein
MYYSPKTSADGLVFHYDTGNTVRSYLGEPTVNLLYSAGATNLLNGAGDIYGRCTKTDLGNGKYRFVNNGTGVSTVRVYTNQGDLINGATYACSVFYENLIGGIGIDWCDTSITGLNFSTNVSGRLGGYGTRGTYDGPYYFLDINFDSGGAVTLFNPQVEYKSHVTPFVAGTRSATQGLKDLTAKNTINISTVSFDSNAQMTFDGSNDYISLADGTKWFTNEWTYEMVLKFNGNTGTYQGLLWGEGDTGGGSGLQKLLTFYNYSYFHYRIQNSVTGWAETDFTPTGYTPTNYNHLVWQFNNGATNLYINGTLAHTNSVRGAYNGGTNSPLYIGSRNDLAYVFNGELPFLKRYSRALTADEVQRNFNAVKSRFNIA